MQGIKPLCSECKRGIMEHEEPQHVIHVGDKVYFSLICWDRAESRGRRANGNAIRVKRPPVR